MLESLKKIFTQSEDTSSNKNVNEHLNLLCGLMIEAAQTDGKVEKIELDHIKDSLINVFGESRSDVDLVIDNALKQIDDPKSLHFFTSKINKTFSEEKKILLIETLWAIVLSDGKIHDFESNLIRRLSGLLYISDITAGIAKKRVLDKK